MDDTTQTISLHARLHYIMKGFGAIVLQVAKAIVLNINFFLI